MIDTNRYIPFIVKHKFTQPQFLLLYLLYKKELHHIKEYKKAFPSDDGSMIGKYPFQQLVDDGYIKFVNQETIELTDKFTYIFIDDFQAGEELIELYPAILVKEGKKFPLKLTDANLLRKLYAQAIVNSKEEHFEVMKDVQYAIENNLIHGKLETFITSKAWKDIRKERLGVPNEVSDNMLNKDL